MTFDRSGALATRRATRQRWRRVAAPTASIALHVLALAYILGAAPGQPGEAGENEGQDGDMTVTLVKASSLNLQPQAVSDEGVLQPLLAQMESEARPVEITPGRPGTRLANLLQRIESQSSPQARKSSVDVRQDASVQGDVDPGQEDRDAAAAGRPGVSSGSQGGGGGLWGAVEPCWRGLPGSSAVAVSLEVALDVRGNVSTPPKVIRAANAPIDEGRLKAEARALSALATCLPRGDLRYGGRAYRLDFPVGGRSRTSSAQLDR